MKLNEIMGHGGFPSRTPDRTEIDSRSFKDDEMRGELRGDTPRRGYKPPAGRRSMPFRQYLKVPYEEREIAKQDGAKWDPDKKMWYIPISPGVQYDPGPQYQHWLIDPRDV